VSRRRCHCADITRTSSCGGFSGFGPFGFFFSSCTPRLLRPDARLADALEERLRFADALEEA
jgi:hypothetical protein